MINSPRIIHFIDAHNSTIRLAHRYWVGDKVPRKINIKRVGKGSG
jgi:hypothetical protein